MTKCKYWDCGFCYAPDDVKTNATQSGCFEPEHCPYLKSQMTEIEKTEGEIKVLQAKLELLKEIETHKSQPKMTYVNEGKVEIVSYNDMTYYRLDLPDDVYWYISKRDVDDAILLKQITYGETHRLLEGLWFNEIKKGKYKEDGVFEKPKPKTLYDVIYQWKYDTYDPTCDKLVDMIEEWLPDDEFNLNKVYQIGWNDALRSIKEKLR